MKKIILIIISILLISIYYVSATESVITDTILLKSPENPKSYDIDGINYKIDYIADYHTSGYFTINGEMKKLNIGENISLNQNVRFRLDDLTNPSGLNFAAFSFIIQNNCGNNVCDSGETCSSCTKDCGCKSGYTCNSNQCVEEIICGDGKCSSGESCSKDNCCSGKLSDFKYDNENCGGCNNKCYSGTKCDNGICISAQINSDLSSYPDFLIKNGQFDFTTAVGDKSSSINVVAQTSILSSLSNIGKGMSVKNKLASEIIDLNQNIISAGNPCINEISAKIMGNPQPCDKDFQRGRGYIKLYKNNGFAYLVVAGYSDLGTRKAAEILSNYKDHKFQDNEYVFEFSGDEGATVKTEEKKENTTKIEAPKSVDTTQLKEKLNIQKKNETNLKIESKDNLTVAVNDSKQVQKQIEKPNVVKKFVSWFLSLFRK